MPDPTIEEMAARYVAELRAAHEGPYLLGGYSGGGIVTFEMVRQLQELGEEVEFLVLFDSVPPGRAARHRSEQVRNLLGNIRRHGYAPLRPYVRERVKGAVRRVIPRSTSASRRAPRVRARDRRPRRRGPRLRQPLLLLQRDAPTATR